jgi:hypothetical protein
VANTGYHTNSIRTTHHHPFGAGLPREPHHRAQLKYVFFPSFTLILLPKFLRELLAAINVLRADKINCDLHTVSHIRNLDEGLVIEGQNEEQMRTNEPDVHNLPV